MEILITRKMVNKVIISYKNETYIGNYNDIEYVPKQDIKLQHNQISNMEFTNKNN